MHGLLKATRPPGQRHYRRRGRHFRNGQCAAALRADTAARILLGLPVSAGSVAEAAAKAAAAVRKRVALIKAYREATPDDLAALTRTVGVDRVFDAVIAPALS